MIDIDALEALANAATSGPWTIDKNCLDPRKCLYVAKGTPDDLRGRVLEVFQNCLVRSPEWEANADFIVAARNSINEFIAEFRRMRALLDNRPALNAGLVEAYHLWTAGVYESDVSAHSGETKQ